MLIVDFEQMKINNHMLLGNKLSFACLIECMRLGYANAIAGL